MAENIACNYLIKRGYKIVKRNFRSKFGEIDIIAKDGDTLVFVEVKARRSLKFGQPEYSVTLYKLFKIQKTVGYYWITHPGGNQKSRIEVVSIFIASGRPPEIKIIPVT